ncbi:MAG: hypothetical protein RL605_952 [Actinomycetota bacterium]
MWVLTADANNPPSLAQQGKDTKDLGREKREYLRLEGRVKIGAHGHFDSLALTQPQAEQGKHARCRHSWLAGASDFDGMAAGLTDSHEFGGRARVQPLWCRNC